MHSNDDNDDDMWWQDVMMELWRNKQEGRINPERNWLNLAGKKIGGFGHSSFMNKLREECGVLFCKYWLNKPGIIFV